MRRSLRPVPEAVGPFEGMSFRVVEATAGSVRGVLSLLGRDADIEVPKGIAALV